MNKTAIRKKLQEMKYNKRCREDFITYLKFKNLLGENMINFDKLFSSFLESTRGIYNR